MIALRLPSCIREELHNGPQLVDGRVALGHRRRPRHRPGDQRAARGERRDGRRQLPARRRGRRRRRSTRSPRPAAARRPTPRSVDDADECQAMVDAVVADFGGIDILVCNAGIASRGTAVADTDPAEMIRVVTTHAFGPHHLARLRAAVDAQPRPRRHRDDLVGGHVVHGPERGAVQHGQGGDGGVGVHAGQGGAPATASTSTSSRPASSRPTWASACAVPASATATWRTSARSTPRRRSGGCASRSTWPTSCCGCAATAPATSPASASSATAAG